MAKRKDAENEGGSTAAPGHRAVPLPVLIAMVVAVALLVGGGAVAAVMFFKPAAPAAVEDGEEVLAEAGTHAEEGPMEGGAYLSIEDPFVVNLQPDPAFPYSYLKFAVSLEVADEHAAEVLSEKLPKIKAVINRLMNNLPYAELATERGQKKCTDRMVAELNEALAPAAEQADAGKDHGPAVYAAYFTTLVAQ